MKNSAKFRKVTDRVLSRQIFLFLIIFSSVPVIAQTVDSKSLFGKQLIVREPENNSLETESSEKPAIAEITAKKQKTLIAKTSDVLPINRVQTGTTVADINAYIQKYCRIYRIDPRLIYAQMNQESSFKIKATSYKGASGLMQLMPGTARRFGVTNIYDPRQNIEAGVKYMRWLLDQFGDIRLALAGYNAGEGAVWKYGNRIPPYRETIQYVEKISYNYYGEPGHGTAFAWNLPLAMRHAQGVYQGRNISVRPKTIFTETENQALSLAAKRTSDRNIMSDEPDKFEKVSEELTDQTDPTVQEQRKVLAASLFKIKDK